MQEQVKPSVGLSSHTVSYAETGAFSPLMLDYLSEKEAVRPFYNRFPHIRNFGAQIEEKKLQPVNRQVLQDAIVRQYKTGGIKRPPETLSWLGEENTFTITTGHQLVLFTGPVYFIYKIVSAIKACRQLSSQYPKQRFVPVFWMASEDHDLAEANHFYPASDCKIEWPTGQSGAVGRMNTDRLDELLVLIEKQFGIGYNAAELAEMFKNAYLQSKTIAAATRKLVHQLFGQYGVVVVDGDDIDLKKLAVPVFSKELCDEAFFSAIEKTTAGLSQHYKAQVHPREINLFYLRNSVRERIVLEEGNYFVLNTELQFTREQILKELAQHPERFSPNVVLRPVYQELILPNLAYIGGGGELAYWLQLKEGFSHFNLVFPMLMLRNSALILTEKVLEKMRAAGMATTDLFLGHTQLEEVLVKKHLHSDLKLDVEKEQLADLFNNIGNRLSEVEPKLQRSAKSAEVRAMHLLDNLEKKWLRAEKKRHEAILNLLTEIRHSTMPNGNLQERALNFSGFWCRYGRNFIDTLIREFEPFEYRFTILSESKK